MRWWVLCVLAARAFVPPPRGQRRVARRCASPAGAEAAAEAAALKAKHQLMLEASIKRARDQQISQLRQGVKQLDLDKKNTSIPLATFLKTTRPETFSVYARAARAVSVKQAAAGAALCIVFSLLTCERRELRFLFWPFVPWPVALAGVLGAQALVDVVFAKVFRARGVFADKHVASFSPVPRSLCAAAGPCAVAAASAAFLEEFLFRGIFLQGLALFMDAGLAAVVAALAFGASHAINVDHGRFGYALEAFGFGIFLGLASVYTGGGLFVPVSAHFLYNWVKALSCLQRINAATPKEAQTFLSMGS